MHATAIRSPFKSGLFAPVLLLGLSALLAGCAPDITDEPWGMEPAATAPAGQTDPTAPVRDLSQPVRVALLAPLTAPDESAAELGDALANSARMALADAGTAGVQLEVYDTGGTPVQAASAARRAVSEGADMIVGPLFADTTRAVAPVASQAGINVVSFSTDVGVAGDPVYLSGYLPQAEAERMATFADRRGLDRVAVYYPQTPYGETAWRGMQEAARETGIQVIAAQSYPRSFQGIQQTAASFAERARDAGVDAVLLPDAGQGLRSVGAFLSYAGLSSGHAQYMGLGQWNSPITLEEPALLGGVFPSPDPDRVRAFLSRYAAQYGQRPPNLAVLGYDGVALAAQMLEDARAGGSGALGDRQLTRATGWRGVYGPIRFFPDGTSERGMAVLRVEENGFDLIEPAPQSFGAAL